MVCRHLSLYNLFIVSDLKYIFHYLPVICCCCCCKKIHLLTLFFISATAKQRKRVSLRQSGSAVRPLHVQRCRLIICKHAALKRGGSCCRNTPGAHVITSQRLRNSGVTFEVGAAQVECLVQRVCAPAHAPVSPLKQTCADG